MSVVTGDGPPARCLWLTKGLGRGGVERLLVDMYPLIAAKRFEVEVAYILPWKDAHRADLEAVGAPVHCLGHDRGTADLRWIWALRRLVIDGEFDLVHTHAPVPAAAVRLLNARRPEVSIVHTEHNMWSRYRAPTRLVNEWTYGMNDRVIAVSDVVACSIGDAPFGSKPPVSVVHHGTDLSRIVTFSDDERAARRRLLGLPEHGKIVGSVGNFTLKKNQQMLLRALAQTDDFHLVLVGSGPLEDELRQATRSLDVDDRTTFLGSRNDVLEILPLFDVFALSSTFEGFPIALVEAMATGLPCVTTAAGGVAEIVVDGESGLIVTDAESMARGLERAMSADVAERLGSGAKAAADRLDLNEAVGAMMREYDHALGIRGNDLVQHDCV